VGSNEKLVQNCPEIYLAPASSFGTMRDVEGRLHVTMIGEY
jgi:hypothetical protein